MEVDLTNRQGDANELEKVKDIGRELSNHMIQTRKLDNKVAMKVHKMEIFCKMKMCSSGIGNGSLTDKGLQRRVPHKQQIYILKKKQH